MVEYNVIDVLISSVIALIMFGISLSLTPESFKNIFKYPKSLIVGLSAQMMFLPVIAFLFGIIFDLSPEFKIGLIILSVCPGGTTSNFITFLLNGNTALSVSMTTVNSFLTLFSIPFFVNLAFVFFLGTANDFSLPYGQTILQIFLVTIFPAAIGLFIKITRPKLAQKINFKIKFKYRGVKTRFSFIKMFTTFLLALVFIIKLFADKESGGVGLSVDDLKKLLPNTLLFNLVGLFFGFFISLLLKLKKDTPMTVGIEVGLQNTTLAFLVAGTLLQNIEMQKPALVYALFSFWTAIVFGFMVKYFIRKRRYKQLMDLRRRKYKSRKKTS